jgi:hypothetical protein
VGRLGVALEDGTAGSTSLHGLLLLPVLLERANALLASVALGVGQAVWHPPVFVQRPGNGPAYPRSSRSPSSSLARSVMSGVGRGRIHAGPIS